ncbi:hypothetical protein [Rhodoferax sp.]|uniref:hypothetical protein n=1 Tax=Rhodoferax sp. TaxID=50421 RepID=UPI00374D8974
MHLDTRIQWPSYELDLTAPPSARRRPSWITRLGQWRSDRYAANGRAHAYAHAHPHADLRNLRRQNRLHSYEAYVH